MNSIRNGLGMRETAIHLTTVKKISQRGLVAVAIMLALILTFYAMADAAPQIVPIPCGTDIDATINNTKLYPRTTPQRFVLKEDCPAIGGQFPGPYVASAPIVPSDGDCCAAVVLINKGTLLFSEGGLCAIE